MNFEHDANEKEKSPWKVNVEQKRKQCGESDKILIDVKTEGKTINISSEL